MYRVLGCKSLGRRKSDEWVLWQENATAIVSPGGAFADFEAVVYVEDETVVAHFVRRPAQWVQANVTDHRIAKRESGGA